MQESTARAQVVYLLEPADFYASKHGEIWAAVQELARRGEPSDIVTLPGELRRSERLDDLGGIEYLMQLYRRPEIAGNALAYADIVKKAAVRRRMGALVAGLVSGAADPSLTAEEYLGQVSDSLAKALAEGEQARRGLQPITELLDWVQEHFDAWREHRNPAGAAFVHTGYPCIDQISPLAVGELTVIAARPRVGKTQLAQFLAKAVAGQGLPVLWFSLEMGRDQLFPRLIASQASLNLQNVRLGDMREQDWDLAALEAARLVTLPIALEYTPALTSDAIQAACLRYTAEHKKPGLVIVDYLQIMGDRGRRDQRRDEVVDETVKNMRRLAQQLPAHVALLAQLNREAEKRLDKKPQLSDLRESGGIENHADNVWLLHRPEIYEPDKPEWASKLAIILAKQRQGPQGHIWLRFDRFTGRIDALPQRDWPQKL